MFIVVIIIITKNDLLLSKAIFVFLLLLLCNWVHVCLAFFVTSLRHCGHNFYTWWHYGAQYRSALWGVKGQGHGHKARKWVTTFLCRELEQAPWATDVADDEVTALKKWTDEHIMVENVIIVKPFHSDNWINGLHVADAGSAVERIGMLRFVAGCCKRWLNQALSASISLSRGFCVCFLLFTF